MKHSTRDLFLGLTAAWVAALVVVVVVVLVLVL